ncbi:MAG TPA: class I SAM-dependent methyltransferase [Herpetosiphonaceae bacterium]
MRGIYEAYAPIYRQMNQGAWSERMARWTLGWLAARGVAEGRVVDWGCGDGAAAVSFAQAGWHVQGIDRSRAMLALARRRPQPAGRIAWHEADLCSAPVEQPGELATAFYDTLNYLTSIADLGTAWRTLARSIVRGGYVIADVNTPYEYTTAWTGQYVITADRDDLLVLNRLRYAADTRLATGRIIWFAREAASDIWQRGSETHRQRAHSDDEMLAAIEQAGLKLVERRTPQDEPPHPAATRLIYIAQKE